MIMIKSVLANILKYIIFKIVMCFKKRKIERKIYYGNLSDSIVIYNKLTMFQIQEYKYNEKYTRESSDYFKEYVAYYSIRNDRYIHIYYR
jgi:hypothetical protein